MRSAWLALVATTGCESKRAPDTPQSGSAVSAPTARAPADAAAPRPADAVAVAADADVTTVPDPHVRICVWTDHGYLFVDGAGKQAFDGAFDGEAKFQGGRACVT